MLIQRPDTSTTTSKFSIEFYKFTNKSSEYNWVWIIGIHRRVNFRDFLTREVPPFFGKLTPFQLSEIIDEILPGFRVVGMWRIRTVGLDCNRSQVFWTSQTNIWLPSLPRRSLSINGHGSGSSVC